MARWTEPTEKQEASWRKWVAKRPKKIRAIAERLPPWELFRMKSTGQRVVLYSIFEDGTISVLITGKFNLALHDAKVFGIDPDDLEPCDLPAPDEALGAMMSQAEMEENADALRVAVRPDLFVMGSDGKAVRKA